MKIGYRTPSVKSLQHSADFGQRQNNDRPTFDIGSGRNLCFDAEGYRYAQDKLKELYHSKSRPTTFSITPPCKYQLQNAWPQMPFVNVNILGSISTEKDNWLSYIGGWEDNPKQAPVVKALLKILEHGDVFVHGKIIKEDDGPDVGLYKILLFVSRQSLSSALEECQRYPVAGSPQSASRPTTNSHTYMSISEFIQSIINIVVAACCIGGMGWVIWLMFFK